MSYEAWGDDDDGPEGYVTDERAAEMVKEAVEAALAASPRVKVSEAALAAAKRLMTVYHHSTRVGDDDTCARELLRLHEASKDAP